MSANIGTSEVEAPGKLIRRARLLAELSEVLDRAGVEKGGADKLRPAVLKVLRQALEEGRKEVKARFEAGADGASAAAAHCYLMDVLIRCIYDHVARDLYPNANPSKGERLALVALGGYGRGELAPFSDLDLLFLLPYKPTAHSEQVVEAILYYLWDLGLKVGHAVRSTEECLRLAKGDQTILTALLEARWLWGDQDIFFAFKKRFAKELQSGSPVKFISTKLAEREVRHARMGGSRYSLEPNIKDGKGGLRDLHTLLWIAKFAYRVDDLGALVEKGVFTARERQRITKAVSFLWTLRFHLHYQAGRAEERLTFDFQQSIAPDMGYTDHAGTRAVERLMKRYFLVAKDVGALTRIFCAALEARHKRGSGFRLRHLAPGKKIDGFLLEGGRLTVKGPAHFEKTPIDLLRIFQVADARDIDIHPEALLWITQNLKRIDAGVRADPKAAEIFLSLLTSESDPETWLRRMNEAGVLGRFLPDFARVVAQMQYNMYHHFTVDEHTIQAVGVLHAIEKGRLAEVAPIASEVVHKVLSRRVLYMAVFLHDLAKGRAGDHSQEGAKMAERLCPKLGFSAEETETVAWLVLYHLSMSDTAFKRDISDPKAIADFAELVQSLERLRLLLVLTVADIRAVGPGTWTAWKAALLRDLYWRTEEVLSGGLVTEGREARVKQTKEDLSESLKEDGWSQRAIKAHLKRGYPSYWLSCDLGALKRHAAMVRLAEEEGADLSIDLREDDYRNLTEVTVYTPDHSGLFFRLSGAIAVAGASIAQAQIFTLSNGMALDRFFIEDPSGGPFSSERKLKRLRSVIEDTLSGKVKPHLVLAERKPAIPSRTQVFKVPPRVLIDNKASGRHTVIEVNGRDRPGFLYSVTHALSRLQLVIHSAKISTYGERAIDVFYVTSALGDKIEDPRRLKRIRERLMEALGDEGDQKKKAA